MKLWEHEHPYYMCEGNYYANDCFESYDSFDAFLETEGDSDVDLNRIHRWDYKLKSDPDQERDDDVIVFYFVGQRKATLRSVEVKIDPEKDHGAIKEFLKPHAELNQKLWAGVL